MGYELPSIPNSLSVAEQELLEDILTAPGAYKVGITSSKFYGGTYYITDEHGATFDAQGQFQHFGIDTLEPDDFPVGDELVQIRYDLSDGESDPVASDLVDWLFMAVTLVWKNVSPVRITWAATYAYDCEGLEIGGKPRDDLRVVDVSERWGFLIGETLENVSLSHTKSPLYPAWAVNLGFSGDKHLIIALGTCAYIVHTDDAGGMTWEYLDDTPTYSVDDLMVTASESIARNYWPAHWTHGPAWGDLPQESEAD